MEYYQVRIYNPYGKFIKIFEGYERLSAIRKLNNVGSFLMEFTHNLPLQYGSIIQIEQSVNNGVMSLFGETIWFVSGIHIGGGVTQIKAVDANHLINWRIVAYNAETPFSNKRLPADDFIKEVARENWGSPLDPSRYWDVDIGRNYSLAPFVEQAVAHDDLLNTFQTIADISGEKGTRLFFDIVSDYQMNLSFDTYVNHRGVDRRHLVLDENSLMDIELDIDYSHWATVAYSGGNGDGVNREIVVVIDEDGIKAAKYGRREKFVADQDFTLPSEMLDGGKNALYKSRPKFNVTGKLVNTPHLSYGVHYNFGDLVTARHHGYESQCLVDTVTLNIENGIADLEIEFVY